MTIEPRIYRVPLKIGIVVSGVLEVACIWS